MGKWGGLKWERGGVRWRSGKGVEREWVSEKISCAKGQEWGGEVTKQVARVTKSGAGVGK